MRYNIAMFLKENSPFPMHHEGGDMVPRAKTEQVVHTTSVASRTITPWKKELAVFVHTEGIVGDDVCYPVLTHAEYKILSVIVAEPSILVHIDKFLWIYDKEPEISIDQKERSEPKQEGD